MTAELFGSYRTLGPRIVQSASAPYACGLNCGLRFVLRDAAGVVVFGGRPLRRARAASIWALFDFFSPQKSWIDLDSGSSWNVMKKI